MADQGDPKPGLQIERTHLSWERTAVGYLAVTGVLLFHVHGPLTGNRTVLAVMSIALSSAVMVIARQRGRLRVGHDRDGHPTVASPATAVALTGWATAGLALLILLAAVLPGR